MVNVIGREKHYVTTQQLIVNSLYNIVVGNLIIVTFARYN